MICSNKSTKVQEIIIMSLIKNALMVLLLSFSISFNASAELEVGISAKHEGRYDIALMAFEPLVELGFAPAQYELGQMYYDGLGVKKDIAKAAQLYQLSAQQGNAKAQFNLSTLYAEGIGLELSQKEAAKWLKKSANLGLAAAQFNLATRYESGEGVNFDDAKAFYWYTESAEQNYVKAQYNLALMYASGRGVKKSTYLSYVWNTIAGSNGYEDAVKSRAVDARTLSVEKLKMSRNKVQELLRKIETKRTDLQ
jgi:TPR repeat protein